MAQLNPFRAVRPTADKVGWVCARPYEHYSATELAAWLHINPYSFLQVLHPAYVDAQKISLEKRFKSVAHKFSDFIEEGILERDAQPALYVHEITRKNHQCIGVLGLIGLEAYAQGQVAEHEDTLAYRVEIFKDYLAQTHMNAEPVLVMHPEHDSLRNYWDQLRHQSPLFAFSLPDKSFHRIWAIQKASEIQQLQSWYADMSTWYMADGHHRMASLQQYWQNCKPMPAETGYLAYLCSENDVHIHAFNRLIRDVPAAQRQALLLDLEADFVVVPKGHELWQPQSQFEFGLYMDQQCYALYFKHKVDAPKDPLHQLDAQIIYEHLLLPFLQIEDLRNDDRIDYLPSTLGTAGLKTMVDEGAFDLALLLYPATAQQIVAIADARQVMPPKSTYIEPKSYSGLLTHYWGD